MYIHRQDCSLVVGWETGRDSEPAFLDMNRHSLRDGVAPPVVLYQFDPKDPMNPLGLLMAYAEERVMPVVSDFDTFLVGSKGPGALTQCPPPGVCTQHSMPLTAAPLYVLQVKAFSTSRHRPSKSH